MKPSILAVFVLLQWISAPLSIGKGSDWERIQVLQSSTNPRSVPEAVTSRMLQSADAIERKVAICFIGRHRLPGYTAQLANLMQDSNAEVRALAMTAIVFVPDGEQARQAFEDGLRTIPRFGYLRYHLGSLFDWIGLPCLEKATSREIDDWLREGGFKEFEFGNVQLSSDYNENIEQVTIIREPNYQMIEARVPLVTLSQTQVVRNGIIKLQFESLDKSILTKTHARSNEDAGPFDTEPTLSDAKANSVEDFEFNLDDRKLSAYLEMLNDGCRAKFQLDNKTAELTGVIKYEPQSEYDTLGVKSISFSWSPFPLFIRTVRDAEQEMECAQLLQGDLSETTIETLSRLDYAPAAKRLFTCIWEKSSKDENEIAKTAATALAQFDLQSDDRTDVVNAILDQGPVSYGALGPSVWLPAARLEDIDWFAIQACALARLYAWRETLSPATKSGNELDADAIAVLSSAILCIKPHAIKERAKSEAAALLKEALRVSFTFEDELSHDEESQRYELRQLTLACTKIIVRTPDDFWDLMRPIQDRTEILGFWFHYGTTQRGFNDRETELFQYELASKIREHTSKEHSRQQKELLESMNRHVEPEELYLPPYRKAK
jgi:hypothetical protein